MTTLYAQALAALPPMTGTDLPADIQVFPPGDEVEFTLQDYPGQTFKMKVDASVAARAQADLEKIQQANIAGKGSAPFADKNHDDAEATFRPVKFFWAGNDPKAGGVRVQCEWTPYGAQLVRAKAFKYFSGNFLFNKVAGKFLGLINENIGGLVNRPGFASMQAFASGSRVKELDFVLAARAYGDERGIADEIEAQTAYARTPAGRIAYAKLAGYPVPGETPVQEAHASATAQLEEHPFIARAKAHGTANKITDSIAAQSAFARTAEGRALYESYCHSVRVESNQLKVQARAAAKSGEHPFMAKAKAYAITNKIADELEAITSFARTAEGRGLYTEYCEAIAPRR